MALVAHFDFELHQMGAKTTFLNVLLGEEVFMKQLEGFFSSDNEHLVYKLYTSIYGLKQASHQLHLKCHEVITLLGFEENIRDQSIYQKVSESKICFLVIYICSILGAYFIPILVLKFQLKIIVKASVKTRGFLSLFF